MMKSLQSNGTSTASATTAKSSKEPLKKVESVNTEMQAAPARSYAVAWATGSVFPAIIPFEGDARFISEMTSKRCDFCKVSKREGRFGNVSHETTHSSISSCFTSSRFVC